MIGRKVAEGEDNNLLELANGQQHMLSSAVYHESGEKFDKGVKKDEGVVRYYMRHVYLIFAMVLGVNSLVQLYQFSFKIQPIYEDYHDWLVFQQVKRGRDVEVLARALYKSDVYSVERKDN